MLEYIATWKPFGLEGASEDKIAGPNCAGHPGHPGSGPELLPMERVDELVEDNPDSFIRCGSLLRGADPNPLRH